MFTLENHPQRQIIIGLRTKSLTIRKGYVDFAIWAWKQNLYKVSENEQDKNINYFTIEMQLINNELLKHQ